MLLMLVSTSIAQQTFRLIPPDKSLGIIFPGEPRHEHTASIHSEADSYSYANSGTRFVLTFFKVTPVPKGVNANETLRTSIDGTVENARGKLITKEPLTVDGKKGQNQHGSTNGGGWGFVYENASVYQLLVMHRNGEEPSFEQHFFDSFTLAK
jgi:hypothetical protein